MEVNTIYKNPLKVKSRAAYIYPSIYRVMLSSLAPDIIYSMVNSIDEVYMERFVNSRLTGTEPPARSIETNTPLRVFDIILTTLHYEPDIVNLARLLLASGIPVDRNTREIPIVAGGPAVMENPIPYSDMIDVLVIGEAEATVTSIMNKWLETMNKKKFLEEVASLPYTYVPELHSGGKVRKEYVRDLDSAPYPLFQVENTEVEPVYGGGFKLEVSRGCRYWCSFCIETRVFQPYRERSLAFIKDALAKGLPASIWGKRVIVYSLSFPSSANHLNLLEYLIKEDIKVSLPSLRLNFLTDKVLELIRETGQRTLSLAPESFSPRLQRVFFKYVDSWSFITSIIEKVLREGFNVKLYMVYGVKGETLEDISMDIENLRKLAHTARTLGRELSVSLNPLIPKPHTMFQWIGMEEPSRLMEILSIYRRSLGKLVDTRPYDVEWGLIQALIALSSKPLGSLFTRVALSGSSLRSWKTILRDDPLIVKRAINGYRFGDTLPWDFIVLDDLSTRIAESQYSVFSRLINNKGVT